MDDTKTSENVVKWTIEQLLKKMTPFVPKAYTSSRGSAVPTVKMLMERNNITEQEAEEKRLALRRDYCREKVRQLRADRKAKDVREGTPIHDVA